MDIVRTVNGVKYNYCVPATWYIAKQISDSFYEDYDIEAEYTGTAAFLKKCSKQKIVNYHDKEQIYYLKSKTPPVKIGNFCWESNNDLIDYRYILTAAENEILKEQNAVPIFSDIIRYLRAEDIISITGVDTDKNGHDVTICFRAKKKYIAEIGKTMEVKEDMPLYLVPKTAFVRCFVPQAKGQNDGRKKTTKKAKNNR